MGQTVSSEMNYRGLSRKELSTLLTQDRESETGLNQKDLTAYNLTDDQKSYMLYMLHATDFYKKREGPGGANMYVNVMSDKYLNVEGGEKGPLHIIHRVAEGLSSVEPTKELREKIYYEMMEVMDNFKFIPGGRILHGGGREDITTTLNNCYVDAIKTDSIKAIYKTVANEALTYKMGGGCGHDLTILRPDQAPISTTGGGSGGPVGFMNLFSENTNAIAQHGRRGANMQTLNVKHPDIEKFILIKSGNIDKIRYSNLSTLLTNEFMQAVESDSEFELAFPDIGSYMPPRNAQKNHPLQKIKKFYDKNWDGDFKKWGERFSEAQEKGILPSELKPFKIYQTIKARNLWGQIIEKAHSWAEPGLIFLDTIKEYHNLEYCSPLVSTNPCAEQPLPDGGCCNLGAINLSMFVDAERNFLEEDFKRTINTSVRTLDNVIEYNSKRHALPKQRKNALADRRLGLGILGLGDMLVKVGIKYDTQEAINFVDNIMETFRDTAYRASIELAKEKGSFSNFNWEGYSKSKFVQNLPKEIQNDIKKHGIRNGTLLTIAPTGTGAITGQTTGGAEPIVAKEYERRVRKDSVLGEQYVSYDEIHPLIKDLYGDDLENLPNHIVTAHDVDPFFRVKMQATLQKYIDSSISSTVNLPEDTTQEVVAEIYMEAHRQGLKGITVYREGSREGIILTKGSKGLEGRVELVQNNVSLDPRLHQKAQARKYKIKRPQNNDSLHVIFTSDLYVDDVDKKAYFIPDEVFQSMVPLGTADSVSFAQSGIDRTEIFRGPNPDYAELIKRWQSPFSNEEEGIGPNKIKSKEHAVGLALEDICLKNGLVKRDDSTNQLINVVEKQKLRKVEYGSDEYNNIISQASINGNGGKEMSISGNHGNSGSFICGCGSREFIMETGCMSRVCKLCHTPENGGCD